MIAINDNPPSEIWTRSVQAPPTETVGRHRSLHRYNISVLYAVLRGHVQTLYCRGTLRNVTYKDLEASLGTQALLPRH